MNFCTHHFHISSLLYTMLLYLKKRLRMETLRRDAAFVRFPTVSFRACLIALLSASSRIPFRGPTCPDKFNDPLDISPDKGGRCPAFTLGNINRNRFVYNSFLWKPCDFCVCIINKNGIALFICNRYGIISEIKYGLDIFYALARRN